MEKEERLSILMVEDNKDDQHLVEHVLRKSSLVFVSECVDNRWEFMEAFHRLKPDVILCDHEMPQFDSFEALKISVFIDPDVPFILVTGEVSDDDAISYLQNGVDDYILKSNLSRLPVAIHNVVKKRALEKLKRSAEVFLRKQNAELLKVNKELDNFVYSVSHNLRGPLLSVVGLLNVAENLSRKPGLIEIHDKIRTSISRLDHTLLDIIQYSQNARNEVVRDPVDWTTIIAGTLKALEYIHPEEHIATNVSLSTSVAFFSDAKRLEVIFNTLLANSISYRSGNKELQINVEVSTTKGAAVIVVKDNGIGIPEEILPKIYAMFFRGTDRSHGSGLGLYVVKEIVSKLNGKVEITSVVGEGTTVTMVIPNGIAQEVADPTTSALVNADKIPESGEE
jgi:signal transduction histidine kinase